MNRHLNADTVFDYDVGLQGYNLYVYCGNSPTFRIDCSGDDSSKLDDGDIVDDQNELYGNSGNAFPSPGNGNGTTDIWESLKNALKDAASGLQMASGSHEGVQIHHIISNKNKSYGADYQKIVDPYNLNLDDDWNKIKISNHRGRHTNTYHDFALEAIAKVDSIANGDPAMFKEGITIIGNYLLEHDWIMYARK